MNPITVAIFDVNEKAILAGPQNKSARVLYAIFKAQPDIKTLIVTSKIIRQNKLEGVDVFVVPGGGNVLVQQWMLGIRGRKIIRDFVRKGGGYFGICSGAFLATNARFGWLALVDVKLHDMKHQNRGGGLINVKLNPDTANAILSPKWINNPLRPMLYWQGPLMRLSTASELTQAKRKQGFGIINEIASFGCVIEPEDAKDEKIRFPEYFSDEHMTGYTACISTTFGKGRVFISSPHLEHPEDNQNMIPEIIHWTAQKGTSLECS
ncbi:biofilm PGA synthesis protein PgaB [Pseudoalteromonas sp. A25]|uniref:BPL-N domain-containing protein n=1 Tax=Pseudoalteromonas sp. A25 TaxID=116092 RepID=UPI00126046CA|nr:BPL-N domain-containing protein [Pseudoalteromonas sp. A25]BBN83348.1 biofilm PGA synthesis protein PgaB [Pseudoalteromonas sp. A25]